LKEKLWMALNGRGAFRRFKDALLSYPEKRGVVQIEEPIFLTKGRKEGNLS